MSDAMATAYCEGSPAELCPPESHNYINHGKKVLIMHDNYFSLQNNTGQLTVKLIFIYQL